MTAEIPDRLRRLVTSAVAPAALTTAGLRERFGDPADIAPAAGQVWRATWDEVSGLVLLVEAEDRRWRVVPVSVEPTGEDEDSLVVDGQETAFGVEVTAWAGLAVSIPTGTLNRVVDLWTPALTDWCRAAAHRSSDNIPDGARGGRPITDPWSPSATVRASLADDLDVLVGAPLVPTQASVPVDLRVPARGVGLSAVVAALAAPQPEVLQILQGKRLATAEQADVLARVLGLTVEDVLAAAGGLPTELAVELEHPRWRGTWRSLARRMRGSEVQTRLQVGFGTFAMAFRQTGKADPDWRGRIGQWLVAEHGDEARDDQ
ncbi:hypothetical protein [Dactylosporangium sp. NPDC005555]|uniref:hypothetical protein n=1 Tax=Dactylosporangium sp. NPDC005555 TaxID=3154889 RepID=UPI00339F45B3